MMQPMQQQQQGYYQQPQQDFYGQPGVITQQPTANQPGELKFRKSYRF